MECCLFENCKYTFDFIMQHFYIIPIGTKIRNTKGDIYELRESQENGKIVRKFSRINGTKLRFLTYNNIRETFWLIKEELLTEEEKEFLKDMCKYYDVTEIRLNNLEIKIFNKDHLASCFYYPDNMKFKNLERGKRYTLEELGLEKN